MAGWLDTFWAEYVNVHMCVYIQNMHMIGTACKNNGNIDL